MVSYFYSIIGMEVYNSTRMVHATSEYVEEYYASFDDIGGALLILMAVINQNGWGALQYDFAVRFDSLASSATFFGTFNAISNMIIISLLTGLIWEVFAFTSKSLAEQLKIDEVLEELSVYDRLLSSKTRGSDDKTPANDDDKPKESKSLDLDNIHKRARSHSEKRHGIPSFTRIDVQKYVNKKSGVKLDNSDHSIEKNGEQHHSFSVVVEDDEEYKAEIPKFKVSKARKNNPAEPDSVKTIDVLPDENAEIAKVNNLPNSTGSVYLTNSQPQVNGIVKMADSSSYNSLKDKALDPNQPTSHVGDYEGAKLTSHDSEEAENKVVELFKKTNKKWNKQATEGNLFKFLNQEKKEMEIPDIDYNDDSFFSDKYSKVLNKINYHKLEKKFFVKKINILNCFTHEKNQMDHMMQIIPGQTLDKFASEVAYLRIEDHEEAQQPPEGEENDDELDMMEIGEIIQLATIGQVSQKKFKEIKDKIHEKILKKKRKMEFCKSFLNSYDSNRCAYSRQNHQKGSYARCRYSQYKGNILINLLIPKKYEEGYLSNLYGTWFHKIKAKSPEFLMTNFETENRCLIRLMR